MHDTRAAARFLSAQLDDLPQKVKNPQGNPALEPSASEVAMPRLLYLMLTLLMTMHASLAHAAAGETWEITTTSEMSGMKMPETKLTICQPKRGEPDPRQMMQDDGNCKISDIKTSGIKTTWKVRCDGDGQKMRGSGEITHNRDSYQGKMRMSGTADGKKWR